MKISDAIDQMVEARGHKGKCPRRTLFATLDAAEAHLREMVLQKMDRSRFMSNPLEAAATVAAAIDSLAAFLNPPDETDDEPKD